MIKTNFAQQYKKKVTHLSQQKGKYGKSKVRYKQSSSRKNTKKTSQSPRRAKKSSMNKHKKRSYKPRNRGGM